MPIPSDGDLPVYAEVDVLVAGGGILDEADISAAHQP